MVPIGGPAEGAIPQGENLRFVCNLVLGIDSDQMKFDEEFTKYLNRRGKDGWTVRECSYRHEGGGGQTMASCLFERKG